jgi:hypothetical protein
MTRLATLRTDMLTLEADLRRYGDSELEAVVKRARREFEGGAGTYTSIVNTIGVDHAAFRK